MPKFPHTKERGRKERKKSQGDRKKRKEEMMTECQMGGGKNMPTDRHEHQTQARWQCLQESSTADRSVNKQHQTSETCAQDCVIEFRLYSMAALPAYKDKHAADKTQDE